jgi:twitching motility protein PilI
VATKTSLRQFQQDLAHKLASARSEPASAARLGVQCGSVLWLVDLAEAGEIMPTPQLATVPLTRPWYAGLANVRGILVSVVDFAAFSTGYATPRGPENRIVLVNQRLGINSALLVSRMLGLRNPRDFTPVAEAAGIEGAAPRAAWEGARWADQAGFEWRELKLARLVADPDFLQVGI